MSWHIVIAGGGFGGLYAARTLERELPRQAARITLVNDVNFMLYTPLLPGAAAGTLNPRHVVVPLREELRSTDLRLGRITGADPGTKRLFMTTHEGHDEQLRYDQMIVAVGSVSRTLPVPGLAEYGIGFKTLPEAIELRNRVLRSLEAAETLEDPAARQAYLTFVFVGAGYAGLEGLAELQDFAADVINLYPRCRTQGMRWILVEARERVMSEINAPLAEFAARELRHRGIEIRTSTTLEEVGELRAQPPFAGPGEGASVRGPQGSRESPPSTASRRMSRERPFFVRLSDGEVVPTRMLCWTAGVRPHPVVAELGLPTDSSGRIEVDRAMHVKGVNGVWAIGDAAAVPDPAKSNSAVSPPTCQHAIRQGRTVARNVAAVLSGRSARPFRYKTLGVFVDMGEGQAVAETLGIRWRGRVAWLLARTYHLAMMPGTKRKLRLLIDWNVQLFFGRDGAELGGLGHPPSLDQTTSGGTPSAPPTIRPTDG